MLLGTPTLSFIRLSSLMYPDEKFVLLMLHVHRLAPARGKDVHKAAGRLRQRSEEHTSELQSLMRISYAVFCLKKKTTKPPDEQHDVNTPYQKYAINKHATSRT